jgi:alkanesulfonate monooxygenase SsuD/methylene tetrahydromethanopterin reductase-like flavin-dependent oxidoreductase (luciferase family)
VAEKLARVYDDVGGFGQLLVFGFDYVDNAAAWHESLRLLAQEVLPKVAHLTPQMTPQEVVSA